MYCVFCNTVAAYSSFPFTRRRGQALPPGDYNFNEVDNNADEDDEDKGDDDDCNDDDGDGDDNDGDADDGDDDDDETMAKGRD